MIENNFRKEINMQEKRTLVVHLPIDVMRRLKVYCAKTDKKIKDYIEEIIVSAIKNPA